MIKINIFGDFRTIDASRLQFGAELQALLDTGNINVLNFEAPVCVEGATPIPKSGPSLYQDKNAPAFLQEQGFNVIGLANNHSLDYGEKAAVETVKSFDKSTTVGCGKWDEAYRVKVVEIQGVKIGFLAITQHEFGALGDEFYDKDRFGTASLSHPRVDELIIEAKDQLDHLFIIPHAGMEYCPQPLPQLVTLYRHYINIGASGVIGNHPHVPQPWEIYYGCPIVYSLGNFCFDKDFKTGEEPNYWNRSIAVSLKVDVDSIDMEIHGVNYDPISHVVNLCDNDEDFISHMDEMCADFRDEDRYKSIIANHAKRMIDSYDYSFSANGFFRYGASRCVRLLLSHCYRMLPGLKRREIDSTHMLNDFQCEAHRWTICHLLRNKDL